MTAWKALRPAVHLAVATVLLTIAGLMWPWLPTKLQSWAPIQIHGAVGQRVTGRDLAVTAYSTFLAHEVVAKGSRGLNRFPSNGIWVVIVLSYEPLLEPEKPRFDLKADGATYDLNLSGFNALVQPEMPQRGPLAFEVPKVPSSATLLVSNKHEESTGIVMEAPLDSEIAINLPLADCVTRPSLNLNELSHE